MARFTIVPDRSTVWIDASSSLHPIHTRTDGLEGYVELEPGTRGQVDLTATVKGHLSLRVDRLRSGNRLEEGELRRRIDARRHPSIDGELTSMQPAGEHGRYLVRGAITFRGVIKEHEGEMLISFTDETVTLEGTSTFDVREFGMEPPRILLLRVEPNVTVRVEIVGRRQFEH